MNKLLTAGAALLALGLSVSAKAADMPVKYVAPAPVFTWTGCYVGAHVGYAWGTSKQEYGGTRSGVPDAFLPVGFDLTGNYNTNGVVGGGQGGCNYQTGAWVWGVEVDGALGFGQRPGQPDRGRDRARAPMRSACSPPTSAGSSTARGRLGWAADRWMWYVTGGAAWTGVDVNNDALAVAANARRVPTRINRSGWVVGVGTEYALLGGWSVKSEFLYTNFGTFGYTDARPRTLASSATALTSSCPNTSGASA